MDVSVIIPVKNGEKLLGHQLEALAAQEYDRPWEVIIVDNRSTDRSRQVAETFAGRLTMKVIDAPERGSAAYARNVGVAAASGSKLVFVDADDEVAPHYVAAMGRALDSSGLVASRLDHVTLNPEWVQGAYGRPWQETGIDVAFDFLPAAGTCSLGVRRSVFEGVGGFSEVFRGATSEDVAFCWDVQLAGTPLTFAPDALLRFRYRHSLRELYRQSLAEGRSLPLLYRQYRRAGMRRRLAVRAWGSAVALLARARSRKQVAAGVVQLGFRVGRLWGSVEYRVLYL